MIISAGYNIAGPEVEGAQLAHDAVLEAAVIGVADAAGLVKTKAFVVTRPGVRADAGLAQGLKAFTKGRLAPYKYPRSIEFVEQLPRTATGKIRRHVLRDLEGGEAAPTAGSGRYQPTSQGADPDTLEVQGVRLEYRWAGEAGSNRPTIVLLHEGLGSASMWRGFPDRLAARTGCPVFAYSRQGYGQSDRAAARRDVDYMHHEAEAVLPLVLEAAGISKPVLFGHSDGASIALIFAARYPQAARGLVLEAPHVLVEAVTLQAIAKAKAVYETSGLAARLGRYHLDVDHAFRGWNDIWLDPRFSAWNIEDLLARVEVPILLIQGRQDEYGTERQIDSIVERTCRAEALVLDSCGHSPHRDQPEAVLTRTCAFIEALEHASAPDRLPT
jgi:pimeloyl-ACP methyl ester carboxylesterase